MPWYFAESGAPVGPVEDAEFETFVATGRIRPEMLVWRKGMAQWEPYRNVNGNAAAAIVHVPGQQACWECHGSFPGSQLATFGRLLFVRTADRCSRKNSAKAYRPVARQP